MRMGEGFLLFMVAHNFDHRQTVTGERVDKRNIGRETGGKGEPLCTEKQLCLRLEIEQKNDTLA